MLMAFGAVERGGQYTSPVGDAQRALPSRVLDAQPREELAGGEVTVLGPWTGQDLDGFWAVVQPFAQRHGVKVVFESTPDVPSILAARIAEGTPPAVAILPGAALVERYARAGALAPLQHLVDVQRLERQYPAGWLDLVTVEGEIYGLFCRVANESLVWYNPAEFQRRRWTIPQTWGEMVALGDRIAASGLTPWALGLQGRSGNIEPGATWIANLILLNGPQTYDRWIRHEIPWTDPAVRQAFLRWGQIVGRPRNLYRGPSGALPASWADAVDALYQDMPAAYLHLEGSFAQTLIARHFPQRTAGRDYDFFPLPPLRLQEEAPVLASADAVVLFQATPQSEALLRYLAGPEAQANWARRGGFVAPNRELDLGEYPDPLSRRAARQLVEAGTLRFDALQLLPPAVGQALRNAVRDYVANPGRLDAILASIEQVVRAAYATGAARTPSARGSGRPAGSNGCPPEPVRGPIVGAHGGAP